MILQYPNPALTRPTVPWDFSGVASGDLLRGHEINLDLTLRAYPNGAAVAANQVGLPHRFFFVRKDIAKKHGIPQLIINPIGVEVGGVTKQEREGCLSFLDTYLPVTRPAKGCFVFSDKEDNLYRVELSGLAARIFFHEMEHLDGETFLKNVSSTARNRVLEKFKKG